MAYPSKNTDTPSFQGKNTSSFAIPSKNTDTPAMGTKHTSTFGLSDTSDRFTYDQTDITYDQATIIYDGVGNQYSYQIKH